MSTMLHTVTEMFWMKSDACATKSRKKSHIPKSPKVQLWEPVVGTIVDTFISGIAVHPVANQGPK